MVQAGHHGRARRGTERCDAACIGVHDALRSQAVDVRGPHIRPAGAAKVQGHFLGRMKRMSGRRAPSGEAASRAPAGRPAAAASSRSRVRSVFGKRCVMMRKVSSIRFCRYKYR